MSAKDFESALEKAKAVAAKLSQTSNTGANYNSLINNGSSNGSLKRSIDDDDSIVNNLKKMAYSNTYLEGKDRLKERTNNGNTIFKPTSIYLEGVIINNEKTLDIMIPGNKVGYIIGKGGEMIRQLQERAGVKMTIIQQSSEVTDGQKQLRIVGEPSKVGFAQQLVKDLLVEKEMELLKFKNKPSNEYGSLPQNYMEIPVSPQYIGLVIGKGGENIKRISQETGAKVLVDTTKTDTNGNKLCQISALNLNAVNLAAEMVKEILDNAMNNKKTPAGSEEVKVSVPANKTGIVIGKGGETIRNIKQQCGCNIELEKNSKGIFIIRGPADRIQYAQQLIGERVQGQVTVLSSTIQNNQAAIAALYPDQYWASQTQYAYGQDPSRVGADTNLGQDSNAAAWTAYYAQYYSQIGLHPQIPVDNSSNTPTQSSVATSSSNNPTDQAAQQDYSSQWAEYYRFYGMEKEAEMIEQMAKKNSTCEKFL